MCRSVGKSTGLDLLRFDLEGLRRQITIKWIPGHSNILGNEITNYVAKQACSESAQLPAVTYTSICARIRHMVKDPSIQHERTAEVYSSYSSSTECQSRSDQTLLESTTDCALTKASYMDLTTHATSAIRSRRIFNTGCRDAKRERN